MHKQSKIDWIFDDKTTEFGLAQAQAVCVCVCVCVSVRFDQQFSIRAIMRNWCRIILLTWINPETCGEEKLPPPSPSPAAAN
ncbi:hypothetical protein T07_5285 [Trichinella nelsoni]|uniref:Uncharacterized protein n=1 Tax=Trichinella nelsoni TaxID=6336 RepID=A0A0V0S0X5_9BILA|nr:hypothetical protein T07_5285 [Trichinella nelsoni]